MNNNRAFWQFPWQYKESIAVVGGIVIIGLILQFITGNFDFSLLRFPVNVIFGGIILLFLSAFSFKRKTHFYQWFSGIPMAVTLISTLVVLGVIMGLTPQFSESNTEAIHSNLPSHLGFTHMTSAWPFVLVYFTTLLSLGALIIRRFRDSCKKVNLKNILHSPLSVFHLKNIGFHLNHIGLWLLLFAAGMGAADIKRYVMHVREGEVEWRVYNEQDEVLDLPIAIELNDFQMEEYPPKLTIINRTTGVSQPEDKAEYFQIDEQQSNGTIADWHISVKEYIHEAIRNSDSSYHKMPMPGSSPAVKIEVNNPDGTKKEGWVCAGNIAQLYMVLNLDSLYCVAMIRPEPKRFVSDIHIFTENGQEKHALLEVNKPCKIGNWMIYQYGYDNDAGKMSSYSSFELVYDPWVIPVYIGIILLACGSICMLWSGQKRKEATIDVE